MSLHDRPGPVHVRHEPGSGFAPMPPFDRPRPGEAILDEAAASLEQTAPPDGAERERAVEVLVVPLRDGRSWRARATGAGPDGVERTVIREGDCPEDLALLAVSAIRSGEPATAPREDEAARLARVEARRPLMGAAAECDDASGFVGFLRGAEAAADFYALAADVGDDCILDPRDLGRSKRTAGVDVLVWQAVRDLSPRETAEVFMAVLCDHPGIGLHAGAIQWAAGALECFPEQWTTTAHCWAALWLAAAQADEGVLPGFRALPAPDSPDNAKASPTEKVIVQVVFLAFAGLEGHARAVLDVCGELADALGGDRGRMMMFLNRVQEHVQESRDHDLRELELVREREERDAARARAKAAAAVAEVEARGWLEHYRAAGVDEEQIEHVRGFPLTADGGEVGDVLCILEALARNARRSS